MNVLRFNWINMNWKNILMELHNSHKTHTHTQSSHTYHIWHITLVTYWVWKYLQRKFWNFSQPVNDEIYNLYWRLCKVSKYCIDIEIADRHSFISHNDFHSWFISSITWHHRRTFNWAQLLYMRCDKRNLSL